MTRLSLPHRAAPAELRRTYFVFYGLSILVGLVILTNILGNFSLRSDQALENTINDQQTAIENYADSHDQLPQIIADAGIKDTKGVDYKKISDNRYMLCANFKTRSDGYTPTAEPVDVQQNASNLGVATSTKFSNGDSGIIQHDKGYTCITYTSYSLNQPVKANVTPPSTVQTYATVRCGNALQRYPQRLSAIVTSVDSAASKINLDTSGQYIYNGKDNTYLSPQALNSSGQPLAFIGFNQNTKFYDASCNPITVADLQPSDKLYVYLYQGTVNSETITTWVEKLPAEATSAPGCNASETAACKPVAQ